MDDKVQVPSGLIRTWKALLSCALLSLVFGGAGWLVGHSMARIEIREQRIEVPYPACKDEVFRTGTASFHMSCSHPDHESLFTKESGFNAEYMLRCSCRRPPLGAGDAGAK